MQRKRNLAYYVWVAHRVTGLILVGYLFLHLWSLSAVLDGAESFDEVMAFFDHPFLRALELGLIGIVVLHTLNGLRLVWLDLFPDWSQQGLMYAVLIVSLLVVLASLPFFFDLP